MALMQSPKQPALPSPPSSSKLGRSRLVVDVSRVGQESSPTFSGRPHLPSARMSPPVDSPVYDIMPAEDSTASVSTLQGLQFSPGALQRAHLSLLTARTPFPLPPAPDELTARLDLLEQDMQADIVVSSRMSRSFSPEKADALELIADSLRLQRRARDKEVASKAERCLELESELEKMKEELHFAKENESKAERDVERCWMQELEENRRLKEALKKAQDELSHTKSKFSEAQAKAREASDSKEEAVSNSRTHEQELRALRGKLLELDTHRQVLKSQLSTLQEENSLILEREKEHNMDEHARTTEFQQRLHKQKDEIEHLKKAHQHAAHQTQHGQAELHKVQAELHKAQSALATERAARKTEKQRRKETEAMIHQVERDKEKALHKAHMEKERMHIDLKKDIELEAEERCSTIIEAAKQKAELHMQVEVDQLKKRLQQIEHERDTALAQNEALRQRHFDVQEKMYAFESKNVQLESDLAREKEQLHDSRAAQRLLSKDIEKLMSTLRNSETDQNTQHLEYNHMLVNQQREAGMALSQLAQVREEATHSKQLADRTLQELERELKLRDKKIEELEENLRRAQQALVSQAAAISKSASRVTVQDQSGVLLTDQPVASVPSPSSAASSPPRSSLFVHADAEDDGPYVLDDSDDEPSVVDASDDGEADESEESELDESDESEPGNANKVNGYVEPTYIPSSAESLDSGRQTGNKDAPVDDAATTHGPEAQDERARHRARASQQDRLMTDPAEEAKDEEVIQTLAESASLILPDTFDGFEVRGHRRIGGNHVRAHTVGNREPSSSEQQGHRSKNDKKHHWNMFSRGGQRK